MLLGYVQIANLALGHIGEDDRIGEPDEDTRAARTVRSAWEPTRLLVLSEANWPFATRTVELTARAPVASFPIARGRTAFPLPDEAVSLIEILEPSLYDDDDEFAVETGPNGAEILAESEGPLVVRILRDGPEIADPARWSADFVEAFAFRLAWQISDGLAADKGRKDRAERSYYRALGKAKRATARTRPFRRNPPSDWSRARHA